MAWHDAQAAGACSAQRRRFAACPHTHRLSRSPACLGGVGRTVDSHNGKLTMLHACTPAPRPNSQRGESRRGALAAGGEGPPFPLPPARKRDASQAAKVGQEQEGGRLGHPTRTRDAESALQRRQPACSPLSLSLCKGCACCWCRHKKAPGCCTPYTSAPRLRRSQPEVAPVASSPAAVLSRCGLSVLLQQAGPSPGCAVQGAEGGVPTKPRRSEGDGMKASPSGGARGRMSVAVARRAAIAQGKAPHQRHTSGKRWVILPRGCHGGARLDAASCR